MPNGWSKQFDSAHRTASTMAVQVMPWQEFAHATIRIR